MTDQNYDNLPDYVKDIIHTYDDDKDGKKECERIHKKLKKTGWTCEYDFMGEITEVYPIIK